MIAMDKRMQDNKPINANADGVDDGRIAVLPAVGGPDGTLGPDDFGPYGYDFDADAAGASAGDTEAFAPGTEGPVADGYVPASYGAASFGMPDGGKRGKNGKNSKRDSRNGAGVAGASEPDKGGKAKIAKRIAIAVLVILLAVLVGLGVWFSSYMQKVSNKLHEGVDENLEAALSEGVKPGDPFYMLLMGVDRSQERADEAGTTDNFRSDSMILARIDPQQKSVTLVSIERDTYVDIEGYGRNKINAAHALGGPALTVSTVSKFAGVPISHYAEIDFDGFKAAVDALGGIEVDVPMEIDDADAGGYVPAGHQTLDGEQALILCRARHAYDEIGPGDLYRAANQRMVIGAIAKKVLASDPVTMANTVTAMADYITTDMSINDIVSVATAMRGIDTENDIYSAMNPTTSSYENGVWIEYCDLPAWRSMMVRIDQGLPPYEDEERNKNDGGTVDGTVWSGEQAAA